MKNKNYSKLNLDLSFIKYIKVHTVELLGWVEWVGWVDWVGWVEWNMMSRLSLVLVGWVGLEAWEGWVEWVGSVG